MINYNLIVVFHVFILDKMALATVFFCSKYKPQFGLNASHFKSDGLLRDMNPGPICKLFAVVCFFSAILICLIIPAKCKGSSSIWSQDLSYP